MKALHHIFPVLLTALVLSGCVTPISEVEDVRGTGTLSLSVGVDAPDLQTKAEAGQTPSPDDGSAFKNLLVVLVNSQDNKVVQKEQFSLPSSGVTSTNVTFAQLPSGDYQIYAFGNYYHSEWLEDQDAMTHLKNITPGNTMPTILLKNDDDGVLASPDGSGMILSGRKTITLSSQTKNDSVILSRPVVRFRVVLENNTDYPVTLNNLAFNDFNASRSYLVDQRASESAAPSLPTSNTYEGLPSFSAVEPVNPHSKDTVYSCLLFENAAPTEYLIKASLAMNAGTDASPDWHYMDLGKPTPTIMTAEEVRDCATEIHNVMLLNPQKNYIYGRLIGLNSDDEQNVKLINQPKPSSGGTLADYVQWLHTIITNPSIKYQFILTLSKENGKYRLLDKKGYNVFAYLRAGENGDAGPRDTLNKANGYALTYKAQDGPNPNEKFDPSFVNYVTPYLMRFFYTYGNKEYILWCRGFDKRNPSDAKEGLWTMPSNKQPGHQDRHFVFFQLRSNGAPLKRIDDRTGRIDPVTYMPRNTEVTAVISVYYNGDGQAEISYEVNNWVEAAESIYTFGN